MSANPRCFTLSRPFTQVRFFFAAAAALILHPMVTHAGGVVNNCTEADLRAALAGGGTVTFACDGVIPLTNTLTIAANTVLDASGRNIVISGAGTVRPFVVNGGIQLTLKKVTVADGFVSSSDAFGLSIGGALLNQG